MRMVEITDNSEHKPKDVGYAIVYSLVGVAFVIMCFALFLVLKHKFLGLGQKRDIGTMRAVIDALVQTMKSWMPLGHSIKIDGLGVFTLSLGFDTSTPSEKEIASEKVGADKGKTKYRHICIKSINFKPDGALSEMPTVRKSSSRKTENAYLCSLNVYNQVDTNEYKTEIIMAAVAAESKALPC